MELPIYQVDAFASAVFKGNLILDRAFAPE